MTEESKFTEILTRCQSEVDRAVTLADKDKVVRRIYQRYWSEAQSVADYIAHPLASLSLITEVYHYAPSMVEQHPRWAALSTDPDWPAALAAPLRELPVAVYSVPAFYMEQLFEAGNGKFIAECMERDGFSVKQYYERLVALQNVSIDVRLADWENRSKWLHYFASSRYAAVRLAVVRNPSTKADVLRLLYKDKDAKVAREAVDHPNFPVDALDAYAAHEEAKLGDKLDQLDTLDWKGLSEFFHSPATPSELLAELAKRPEPEILFACALHPNAPDSVRASALAHPEGWIRSAVALHPLTPESVLRQLASDKDFDVQFALAGNARLPEDLQLQFAAHPERVIRLHLADHARSHAVLAVVSAQAGPANVHSPLESLLALALDPKTPDTKLKSLRSPNTRSRSNQEVQASFISDVIAAHTNFPESLVAEYRYYLPAIDTDNKAIKLFLLEGKKLADPAPWPDWKLTESEIHSLPGHVANHLLRHGDCVGQRTAAGHAWCNKTLLYPLLFSADLLTLKKLALRDDVPRAFYEVLWVAGNDAVRKTLLANPASKRRRASFTRAATAPAALPAALKVGKSGKVTITGSKKERKALAAGSADAALLLALASDKMSEVRMALLDNPALPWLALALLGADAEADIRARCIDALHRFPAEQTLALERQLLAGGEPVRWALASNSRHEEILLALIDSHADGVAKNGYCTMVVGQALLQQAPLESLLLLTPTLRDTAFRLKIVQMIFPAYCRDPQAAQILSGLTGRADEQSRIEHFQKTPADDRMRMFEVGHVMAELADEPEIQHLAQPWLEERDVNRRAWAAQYLVLTPEQMAAFAQGGAEAVRAGLASNRQLDGDTVAMLQHDRSEWVRSSLAVARPELANFFAADASEDVRRDLAEVCLDPDVLRKLAGERNARVVATVAANAHCPDDTLARLATHGNSGVRERVARNLRLPEALVQALLMDRNADVREAARQALDERAGQAAAIALSS
jgi:hypothetical protein